MGKKVFLLRDADVSGKKLLWDAGLEVVVAKGTGESAWIEEMQRGQPAAILTRADRVSAAMMDACPGLKAIGKQGIGLDCIDMDVATQRGIQVVYAPVSNVNAAAEHTMFMIKACARRFSYVDRVFRGGNFDVRYGLHNTFELSGRTLGLIGCGHVGSRVAQKASLGFGMKVIGYDTFLSKEQMAELGVEKYDDKFEALKAADVVIVQMPLIEGVTNNTIAKAELDAMKPTALLINCSRGEIVNEPDLCEALKSGSIAGAGLDVFWNEPTHIDDEILHCPNVIASPHSAAQTREAVIKMAKMCVNGCLAVVDGKKWPYVADKAVYDHPKWAGKEWAEV